MENNKIYKDILDKQNKMCPKCGERISQPHFVNGENGNPSYAICMKCFWGDYEKRINAAFEKFEIQEAEKRKKERENWLDKDHPGYKTRLECAKEGHRVLGASHGFRGGGCWCGYYSPEEKPLKDNEGEIY